MFLIFWPDFIFLVFLKNLKQDIFFQGKIGVERWQIIKHYINILYFDRREHV